MGTFRGAHALNIKSITLQSTSSNLEHLIRPLTVLDNILSDNVNIANQIQDNGKDLAVLKVLFSSILSEKEYNGNQYIWNTFKAFIANKRSIKVNIVELVRWCHNSALLDLIFNDLAVMDSQEDLIENLTLSPNQNLFKSDKVFHFVCVLIFGLLFLTFSFFLDFK